MSESMEDEVVLSTTELRYVKRGAMALVPVPVGGAVPSIIVALDSRAALRCDLSVVVTFGGGESVLAEDAPEDEQAPNDYLDALAEMLDMVKSAILQAKDGGLHA